ncbi:hypothetical protein EYF80_046382 [Liparis tanakae]|uniref:Uncharacterized protein n=1 Tax=Liparis tanakae TaxID=230148 RepID=A0A4Z2FRP5_9TELE|nr:hypothetical protein EYF80_046382 [Liparis tanakae]
MSSTERNNLLLLSLTAVPPHCASPPAVTPPRSREAGSERITVHLKRDECRDCKEQTKPLCSAACGRPSDPDAVSAES